MRRYSTLFLLVLGIGAGGSAQAQTEEIQQATNDLLRFQKYLTKEYPGKKWQTGPSRLDTKEIETAYPGQKFFYVFSAPPLPPGANLPEVQKAYRNKLAAYRKDYISVMARLDAAGKLTELRQPKDFNVGLMKVASDDDAKVAAAAILSLTGAGQVRPSPVSSGKVMVTAQGSGRSCQVRTPFYQGTVTFNSEGRCTAVSKNYTGPLPP